MTKTATIDVGGTFTDCLVMDESGEIKGFKVPSTPPDYSLGVMAALEKAARGYGLPLSGFLGVTGTILHGTTVASNALLTGEGARTGIITTEGFRDIVHMRRGIKKGSIFDMFVPSYQPLVPRYLRMGVRERTLYTGEVLTPVSEQDVRQAIEHLDSRGVESIAVCYLHSYANPANEQRTKLVCKQVHPRVYVVTSSEVMPVWREYERFSTTVVAAYVGPIVDNFLSTLEQRLKDAGFGGALLIVLGSSLVQRVERCRGNAVHLVGSGPAAAPSGGVYWGTQAGYRDIISLDIGGTSTDVALISGGRIPTTTETWIGDERIAVKSVDVHSVGGGGGSIAWCDALDVLRIGPRSAGAEPGPACYGRGGKEPTVTDAALLLGYISPDYFLGGELPLRVNLAREAIGRLGEQLGMDVMETAKAIFRVANNVIAGSITSICTKRGHDPRDHILVAGGGAGPVHGAWLADQLDIPAVVVPRFAGLYSAFGMFTIDIGWEFARSYIGSAQAIDIEKVNKLYSEMEHEALQGLRWLHVAQENVILSRSLDMRYVGQYHEVESDVPGGRLTQGDIEVVAAGFQQRHERLFAFSMPGQPIEFLTFRLRASVGQPPVKLPAREAGASDPSPALKYWRRCVFADKEVDTPIFDGEKLRNHNLISGPAVIEEATTTVVIPEGFQCTVRELGQYVLTKAGK